MSLIKFVSAVTGIVLIVSSAHADGEATKEIQPIDIFGNLTALEEDSLVDLRGGSDTYDNDFVDIDIGDIEINSAQNDATSNAGILNTSIINSQTGSVDGNIMRGNSGISTFMANSGNNVNFQNTVQVNVYTD